MSWMNNDGLYVKFGTEEASKNRGGEHNALNGEHVIEFVLDYTDVQSATDALVDNLSGDATGTVGILVPKGMRIEAVETVVVTAFTSSGTIGSSTLLLGLIKASDRTTELDFNGFTTASFVGSSFDAAGERVYIVPGVTGAGALIGTTITEDGYVSCSNSAHASHPYTAGKLLVRIKGRYSVLN